MLERHKQKMLLKQIADDNNKKSQWILYNMEPVAEQRINRFNSFKSCINNHHQYILQYTLYKQNCITILRTAVKKKEKRAEDQCQFNRKKRNIAILPEKSAREIKKTID